MTNTGVTTKSRISREINWKVYRMKGLASHVRQVQRELLLTPRGQEAAEVLAEELKVVTEKGNDRLHSYRQLSYKDGRVL